MWTKIISVDGIEILPEPFKLVLIAVKARHEERTEVIVTPHYCTPSGGLWYDWQDRPISRWLTVTHWQPMLSPPEGV